MTKGKYLKSNVQVEPLVHGWYAWIHLISPATFSLNVKNRYIPILQSYIEDPELHTEAVADPEMRGGPFVDIVGDRTAEATLMLEKIMHNCQQNLALASDLESLSKWLVHSAKGFSLEPLYRNIPPTLKGLVELYYDLNGSPAFRLFEGLLYKTNFYRPDLQSIALSTIGKDRNRPFILSTPRLGGDNVLDINVPFNSPLIDDLFRSKSRSANPDAIAEQLGLTGEHSRFFGDFFHDKEPRPYSEYNGKGMRIRYFGHACILIEGRGINILVDPVLSYTYDSDISRLTYDDLPDSIDYVLITHSHQDHVLIETMIQIRHKVKCVMLARNLDGFLVDPSLKLALQYLGFANVRELHEMEEVEIPGGTITGIPFLGEHHDLPIHSKICFLVRIEDSSFLAMADSCNIDSSLYERVRMFTDRVDVLFLGMECDGSPPSWAYGPLLPFRISRELDYSRRGRGCNFEEARDLVERFDCSEVYVYAMGLEPWLKYILNVEFAEDSNPIIQSKKLIGYCRSKGIVADLLFGEREILLNGNLTTRS